LEIQASIFRQAWQFAGTQLRAANALGITPDTISRVLRRCDRLRIGSPKVPEAWPVVEPINQVIESWGRKTGQANGPTGHHVIDRENQPPAALRRFSENEGSDLSNPGGQEDLTTED
jgi:hypothetical protein